MARSDFLKRVAKEFYPRLRAEGFRGSGTTLRRIDGEAIHVFNCQGSSTEGRFYLNLGAHYSYLPAEGGGTIQPVDLKEYHCVFRDRIEPPTGPELGWNYGSTDEEDSELLAFIASEWKTQAQPFFDRYAANAEIQLGLLNEAVDKPRHSRDGLHFGRMAMYLGRSDLALRFIREGLADCPERASGLIADLKSLLRVIEKSA